MSFCSVIIVCRKLTVTDVIDLGNGDVFTPSTTAPCLLNRIYSRIFILLKH